MWRSGVQCSRDTASASKMAQMGPPPLWPSPMPAMAALMKLFSCTDVLGVEIAARMIRIDLVMLIAREVVARFIVETFAEHVHEDHVLPVSDSQA